MHRAELVNPQGNHPQDNPQIEPAGAQKPGLNMLRIFLPSLLLLAFVLTCFFSMRRLSLTSDEAKHYRYGQNILAGDSNRFDDSKMPVSALNALPARLAEALPEGALRDWLQKFLAARLATVFFSALTGLVIFSWAREMYGFVPGLAALALYLFDPNILAHSQLVTTDIYAAGTILFSAYALWRFARSHRLRDGLLCAFLLGLSLLAKYSSVVLLPLFALTLLIHDWPQAAMRGKRALTGLFVRIAAWSLAALAICILVINAGFLFNRTFMPLGDYQFQSVFFQNLQKNGSAFDKLPIPVPFPFLQGLDLVSMRDQTGFGHGRIYLLGQLSEGRGIPGYYFVAYLLKEPLAAQILLILALSAYVLQKKYKSFRQDELFLFIPAFFFVLYFNFFYNTQIGIRFYLVIFPLLFIFTGSLFKNWAAFRAWQKVFVFGLFAWLLVSSYSYAPFFLSYMNEIVPERKLAYKYLADSNLDWEQGKLYLDDYLASHPQADYAPKSIKPGLIVVSVNDLVGILGPLNQYAWLRENFEPEETIANEYLVYRISQQQIEQMCARTKYCSQ